MQAKRNISLELLNQVNDNSFVEQYYNNLYYFDLLLPDQYDFYPKIDFILPLSATQQDGKNLALLMEKEKELPYCEQLLKLMKECKVKSFDEFTHLFLDNQQLASHLISELNDNLYCGIFTDELKIMFDGTILSCDNMIFNSMKEILTPIEKLWENHHLSANIYSSSSKDINNLLQIFTQAHTSWSFIIQHIMTNLYYLGKAGLINDYSNDERIIFKYAFLGLTLPWCYYSNLKTTGSIYLQGESFFEFFYNGYIELLEKQYDRMVQL